MQISNFSIIGIIVACVLPFLWTGYAKITSKRYNNSTTRDSVEKFTGKSRRAHFAHLNSFEALPLFMSSVLIANINQVDTTNLHTLIGCFLFFRIVYGILYIQDVATARSIVWTLAILCNILLLALSFH
jgi:uncharacterized MAPEG superfamily protein